MLSTGGTVKLPNLRTSAHTAMPPVTIFTLARPVLHLEPSCERQWPYQLHRCLQTSC
jgi:hypothetical protein